MVTRLLPISALLAGSGLLLFAGGVNGLILPLRGNAEGFSATALGLLGTGWAVGYVTGCLTTPRLVARTGHIRAFGIMAALAAVALLMSLLVLTPWAWVPLRGVSGFCFAGAAMIVESWLNERTEPGQRGSVFGIYTMVNLFATTAGQMALTLGDAGGYTFFVLGAIFYCLALIPTAATSSAAPQPLVSVSLDLAGLWRNSPVAVVGVFMIGISNSAFGALAPVYADRIGLVLVTVALFASLPILSGAAAQIPVGLLSDRVDRRKVLLGLGVLALAVDLVFVLVQPEGRGANLLLSALFGAAIFSMYPVIVAHANDHAPPGSFIQTSGGLLTVFGLGSIAGPLIAGVGMSTIGVSGLFLTSIGAHALLVLFTLLRIRARAPVATEEKGSFVVSPLPRAATPETAALAAAAGDRTPERAPPEAPGSS